MSAIRARKILGGGMRQSGMLAAAALYALENNVDRLAEDHIRVQRLAQALIDQGYTVRWPRAIWSILKLQTHPMSSNEQKSKESISSVPDQQPFVRWFTSTSTMPISTDVLSSLDNIADQHCYPFLNRTGNCERLGISAVIDRRITLGSTMTHASSIHEFGITSVPRVSIDDWNQIREYLCSWTSLCYRRCNGARSIPFGHRFERAHFRRRGHLFQSRVPLRSNDHG